MGLAGVLAKTGLCGQPINQAWSPRSKPGQKANSVGPASGLVKGQSLSMSRSFATFDKNPLPSLSPLGFSIHGPSLCSMDIQPHVASLNLEFPPLMQYPSHNSLE